MSTRRWVILVAMLWVASTSAVALVWAPIGVVAAILVWEGQR